MPPFLADLRRHPSANLFDDGHFHRPRRFTMRTTKLKLFAVSLLAAAVVASFARAQIVSTGGIVLPTLKQQLKAGLLARTPDEQAFVDEVVARVDSGEIPLGLVQSTFLWARRHRPYPMQYFERALRVRAAELGIDI
jgi:hypothetical protein